MRAGTLCSLTSVIRRSTLLLSKLASAGPLMPLRMLFGKNSALLKHVGGLRQDRCEMFCMLPCLPCCAAGTFRIA